MAEQDRKTISYTFDSPNAYHKHDKHVTDIVSRDSGVASWICNRALPPTCFPPPLTVTAIDMLKQLDGVVVKMLPDSK